MRGTTGDDAKATMSTSNRTPSPAGRAPLRAVSDDERESFARDGVVHLKAIYPERWVDDLRRKLTDVFDRRVERSSDRGPRPSVRGGRTDGLRVDMAELVNGLRRTARSADLALEDGPDSPITGRSVVETDAASWHDGLRAHHLDGPLPEIVAMLTGTDKVVFYSDQLFLKEPGSQVRTPFHQDEPYFLVDGSVAVCWVPVDRVGHDNGPMWYVRGSHRWGRLFKPSDFVTDRGVFPEVDGIRHDDLELLPPIGRDSHDLVSFAAEPGDVIVHHWSTVHGAAGNVSATATRRAASVRYAIGDSRFFRRPSSPEPFRARVEIADGEPLERAERFPVVWPSSSG